MPNPTPRTPLFALTLLLAGCGAGQPPSAPNASSDPAHHAGHAGVPSAEAPASATALAGASATPPAGAPTANAVASGAWSNPATWGGAVPGAGAFVTIPAGRAVTLDRDADVARLTVEGTLTVARRDLALRAGHVLVTGAFTVGSAAQPFAQRFTLTLTGTSPDENILGTGTKCLCATNGGRIELYGTPRATWARLGATAEAGDTTITLEQATGWRVGEEIVLAPTGFDPQEAETRVVRAVDGSRVTLDAPLRFRHFGQRQSFGGVDLDERASVGLLTHNVVVTSDVATNAAARDLGLGGHVMVMGGASVGRFQGVEFARLGQRGRLGRYGGPHWHLVRDATDLFMRDSSVHRSFNRFASVHGTNRVTIANNVAFDALGHGFIVEDGVETGNLFERNLGVLVRPVTQGKLIASDDRPAVFWITNPDNTFRGNVAAGAQGGQGFWYELPERPLGVSTGSPVRPQRAPFGVFEGNVAHTNESAGLRFDQYLGTTRTSDVTAFRNGLGVWFESFSLSSSNFMDRYRMSGNRLQTRNTHAVFTNALFVGTGANRLATEPLKRAVEVYDGQTSVLGGVVANFGPGETIVTMRGTTEATDNTPVFAGLRFVDVAGPRGAFRSYYEGRAVEPNSWQDPALRDILFEDRDGSLLGGRPAWILNRNVLTRTPQCTERPDLGAWTCPRDTHSYLRVGVRPEGRPADAAYVRDDGAALTIYGAARSYAQYLLAGRTYRLRYTGDPGSQIAVGGLSSRYSPVATALPDPASVWVRFVVPVPWTGVRESRDAAPVASLAALAASPVDGYFFDAARRELHVKVTGASAREFRFLPR